MEASACSAVEPSSAPPPQPPTSATEVSADRLFPVLPPPPVMGSTPASVDCNELLLHLMGPSMAQVSPPVIALSPPGPRNSGDSPAPLKIWVDFVGSKGLESYHIAATEVHLISDLKRLFERQMGIDLYSPVRKLIASQDGITLTDAIWLKDLNPDSPVSMILVEQQEEANLSGSAVAAAFDENLADEIPTEGWEECSWDPSNSEWSDFYEATVMSNVIPNEEGVFDPENEPGVYEVVTSPGRSKTDASPEVTFSGVAETLPSMIPQFSQRLSVQRNSNLNNYQYHSEDQTDLNETSNVRAEENTCLPQQTSILDQDQPNTSLSKESTLLGIPQASSSVGQRLVVPRDFSDKNLVEAKTHGFKTSYDLRASINRGPPRWISKKEAYALATNPQLFLIDGVTEEDKTDGKVCVIDSRTCCLPQKLKGYKITLDAESTEKPLGVRKCKGITLDRFEVQGQKWIRRRQNLPDREKHFHIVQWRQYATRERQTQQVNDSREPEQTQESNLQVNNTATLSLILEKQVRILEKQDEMQKMVENIIARLDKIEGKHEHGDRQVEDV